MTSLANGVNAIRRLVPFSPRERLEAFGDDFDMIKPFLMYNMESMQVLRAD